MSARIRAPDRQQAFDARIIRLIEMASDPRPTDLVRLGRIGYEMFCTGEPPEPMMSCLRPDVFVSFDRGQRLEAIIFAALERRLPSAQAFAQALSDAFGPYLIEAPGVTEELILFGIRESVPFAACLAIDGVHAIDLLIEDPNRRLVARTGREAIELLDALRECMLRRAPILLDHESARFPHPDFVRYRPITQHDVEVLQALCPSAAQDSDLWVP